jgi:hypothetical protein
MFSLKFPSLGSNKNKDAFSIIEKEGFFYIKIHIANFKKTYSKLQLSKFDLTDVPFIPFGSYYLKKFSVFPWELKNFISDATRFYSLDSAIDALKNYIADKEICKEVKTKAKTKKPTILEHRIKL